MKGIHSAGFLQERGALPRDEEWLIGIGENLLRIVCLTLHSFTPDSRDVGDTETHLPKGLKHCTVMRRSIPPDTEGVIT